MNCLSSTLSALTERLRRSTGRPQRLGRVVAHQSLDSMLATGIAQLQNIEPDEPCTISQVPGHEALEDFGANSLIFQISLAHRPSAPGIEVNDGYTERHT